MKSVCQDDHKVQVDAGFKQLGKLVVKEVVAAFYFLPTWLHNQIAAAMQNYYNYVDILTIL